MQLSRTQLWNRDQFDLRYFIYGKELYLVERCCEKIRQRASENGYTERISLTVSPDFQWETFTNQIGQLDLFGTRKLVELRLPPSGRPGQRGAKVLTECVKSPSDDAAVVVIGGAIESSVKQTAWFKAWNSKAVTVDNPEMHRREFESWVKNTLTRRNVPHEPEVVGRLVYYFEGNMLAAANEIRKLVIGNDGSTITVDEIDRIVADQARFNVYSFADACLSGNVPRALRQLQVLQNEGTEPILVLWALAREMRTVHRIAIAVANGLQTGPIFNKLRIWQSRQQSIGKAAQRLGATGSASLMRRLARADRILKGRETAQAGGIWDEFENIVLQMCGASRRFQ